jgi:hypothetical protein
VFLRELALKQAALRKKLQRGASAVSGGKSLGHKQLMNPAVEC